MNSQNSKYTTSFIIVIRSAGERTADLCKKIADTNIGEYQVHVINETPFEEALRVSYDIGMNSEAEWLITIDADVIPREEFLNEISLLTKKVPEKLFTFKAMIYDKFFQKHRLAGFRVYRCSLLKEARSLVPENGKQIRPEQYTVNLMEKRGYRTKIFDYVVGLHDFEQFYEDIYRKAFFHATKHPHLIAENLPLWKKKSEFDDDFTVMMKGSVDGLLSSAKPTADINFFKERAKNALEELGIHEKKPVQLILSKSIQEVLKKNGEFYKDYSLKAAKEKVGVYGYVNGLIHHLGYLLETTGSVIQKKIEGK